jgi:hypothetical protein
VQNHQDFDFVLSPIADPQVPMPDHEPGETSRAHGISLDPREGDASHPKRVSLHALRSAALSSDAAPLPPEKAAPGRSVILKRTRQSRAFRDGNQLIFTKAVDRIEGKVKVEYCANSSGEQNRRKGCHLGLGRLATLTRCTGPYCHVHVQPVLHKQ